MIKSTTKVILFQVQTPQEKIAKIIAAAKKHFFEKHPLVFLVQSEKAAIYIDDLLWKTPKEGFLPHLILSDSTKMPLEYLLITDNIDRAKGVKSVFYLRSEPFASSQLFSTIYDFEDQTSLERKNLFEKRYKTYLDQRLHLISL